MPTETKNIIVMGIDLGTTNSAASSIHDGGDVVSIKNAEGSYTTPSVSCFMDNGEIIVGQEAKNMAVAFPQSTIREIKRQMGKVDDKGKPIIFFVDPHGKGWTPEELSALILKKIKNDVETIIGQKIGLVVITVPAYFRDPERHATINAGKAAGFEEVHIIDEPMAAALHYGAKKNAKGKCFYMVYDFGGGTFDLSIIEVPGDGNFKAISTEGERDLGGSDCDMRITARVQEEAAKHGVSLDPATDPAACQEAKDKVEKLKHSLSVRTESMFNQNIQGKQVNFTYTRKEFESDTRDLLERTGVKLEAALKEAKISPSDIEDLILVGGATRMPMIEEYLTKLMGKPPKKDADPDLVVSQGAALAAALIASKKGLPFRSLNGTKPPKRLPVKDITNIAAHCLGCSAYNSQRTSKEFVPIIKKNIPLPAKCTETFSLLDENQTTAVVEVYQGQEGDSLEKCVHIGDVELSGLPTGDPTEERITVTYEYSTSGIVGVTITDSKSGRSTNGEIKHKLGMNEKDIKKAKKKVAEKSA